MAWRSSGNTNKELVNNLIKNAIIQTERVKNAMLAVDRGDFTQTCPYEDRPQSIGYNATISAPHMHAAALEFLNDHLKEGAKVLDVGCGSGYLTTCMALMVGSTGSVIGIDHINELVNESIRNVKKHHINLLDNGNITFITGDGRMGYCAKAPYDAIHVGAASKGLPQELVDQLAEGGRMMIPVELSSGNQVFTQVDKHIGGRVTESVVEHVIYVPLTSRDEQLKRNLNW
ncbi:unnamed protein product [Caenorhabditis bovis]|uniref:Protein-L-isoaspartate O-methyltransferase n=1 Tax=Caenorhabditis bovis TaxID=2654633 RepID=A0A8S1EML7_9PELO|nr:unnamed protein product [Caenorhabditis bovis]